MFLNRLKQALVEGYRLTMNVPPDGALIVATLLPRSFPGGPVPEEYRREFRCTQDLMESLDRFAEEATDIEEPNWKELGYLDDEDDDDEDDD